MKRISAVVLFVGILTVSVFAVTSCGDDNLYTGVFTTTSENQAGFIPINPVINNQPKTVTITYDDNIIEKLKTVNDGDTVILKHGTYDLIEAYKDYYGDDFWDTYDGYLDNDDEFYQGLPIKRGTKWICSPNAEIVCIYNGDNPNVEKYFSPINTGDGYSITGLNLRSKGCRYAIHDDFNTSATPRICEMRNCHIVSETSRAIGGGLGVSNSYIFDGNYFEGATASITYHNNGVNARSQMNITNNYFVGTVSFRHYGTSTDKSTVLLSGNSMSDNYQLIQEIEGGVIENIEVIAWNNEIRQ